MSYSKLLCTSSEISVSSCALSSISCQVYQKFKVKLGPEQVTSRDQSSNNSPQCRTGGLICCHVSQAPFLSDSVLVISSLKFPSKSFLWLFVSLFLSPVASRICSLTPSPSNKHTPSPCYTSRVCQCALSRLLGVAV